MTNPTQIDPFIKEDNTLIQTFEADDAECISQMSAERKTERQSFADQAMNDKREKQTPMLE